MTCAASKTRKVLAPAGFAVLLLLAIAGCGSGGATTHRSAQQEAQLFRQELAKTRAEEVEGRRQEAAERQAGDRSSSGKRSRSQAPSHYSSTARANILRACKATGGNTADVNARCECFLSHIEARMSEATVASWERAFFEGRATLPSSVREAALACRAA